MTLLDLDKPENRALFAAASNKLGEMLASLHTKKSEREADAMVNAIYGAASMAHQLGLVSIEAWAAWTKAAEDLRSRTYAER